MDQPIRNFPVTVYGNLEKYNEVISKGRCRIFYKGDNRNGTFITDDFAEKLISTIPYTPVKGIYSEEDGDFTDHGAKRTLGRIYGVVPQEPNFAWEKHVDDDGVEREYACVDVLYYTGLYGEAGTIPGKAQSMELYAPSIKGEWKILNGKRCYVYSDACFLGLQALGNGTEPCFEGAAFYGLFASMKDFIDEIEKYNNKSQNGSGGTKMHTLFRLSDSQKENALWTLLNSETDEDGYRIFAYAIQDVYDDYALVYNYAEQQFERAYYKKDDATDSLEITSKVKCFVLDVTESEKAALDNLRKLNGETYEKADEVFGSVETIKAENSELSTKNAELSNDIATLTTERDNATQEVARVTADYTAAQDTIATLTAEKDELVSYKKSIEDAAKLKVIDSYSTSLSAEILDQYRQNLDKYTCEDLDMRLTYDVKKTNPTMFSNTANDGYVPSDDTPRNGIESILARYEKK